MRPEILYPAFASIISLKGCGPRTAKRLEDLAGPRILDLWWHWPTSLVDRRHISNVRDAAPGNLVSLELEIIQHDKPRNNRLPYRILCQDQTGFITLAFFQGREDYLLKTYPIGERRWVSGRVEHFGVEKQILHPERTVKPGEEKDLLIVEPIYPMTAGLSAKNLRSWIKEAVGHTPNFPEWQDSNLLKREGWPDFKAALHAVHEPQLEKDILSRTPARLRLGYDELFAHQLALLLTRRHSLKAKARILKPTGAIAKRLENLLPWPLTSGQKQAIEDSLSDIASGERMLRLLQGDVGSGKTMVAFFTMLAAIECGGQAALMAPTEILARQHFKTLSHYAQQLDVSIILLTGRDKGAVRMEKLAAIADGHAAIIIGTHALFQDGVNFADLALVIIDEQHRFGVHQRLMLGKKGEGTHLLVMTATPIPRTLALTLYGDMDVSVLKEKPAGRKPIETRILPSDRMDELIAALGRKLSSGEKIFWVCPMVDESEVIDLANATERQKHLATTIGCRVGLVHGRMKGPEKDQAMADFLSGKIQILVATTVIEVGVDVPDATVMVIEDAERFGLAQLHQLRGRIGRSDQPGTCILLYRGPLDGNSRARLKIMRETNDGFVIAEEDLRLRGPGDIMGKVQSGAPLYRIAAADILTEWLPVARDDARLLVEKDPTLSSERGQAARILLYLFERDAAVHYFRAG